VRIENKKSSIQKPTLSNVGASWFTIPYFYGRATASPLGRFQVGRFGPNRRPAAADIILTSRFSLITPVR